MSTTTSIQGGWYRGGFTKTGHRRKRMRAPGKMPPAHLSHLCNTSIWRRTKRPKIHAQLRDRGGRLPNYISANYAPAKRIGEEDSKTNPSPPKTDEVNIIVTANMVLNLMCDKCVMITEPTSVPTVKLETDQSPTADTKIAADPLKLGYQYSPPSMSTQFLREFRESVDDLPMALSQPNYYVAPPPPPPRLHVPKTRNSAPLPTTHESTCPTLS